MLTDLSLTNFKNHLDTKLTGLAGLSVLVGPNGAGKSSVLEAAHYIHQLGRKRPEELFASKSVRSPDILVRRERESFGVRAAGVVGEHHWNVDLTYQHGDSGWNASMLVGWDQSEPKEANYNPGQLVAAPWVREALSRAVYFRLEPSQLRQASYPEKLPPRVEFDGYGLPSAVSYLMRTDPDAHRKLADLLHEVVPAVTFVRTNPVQVPRRRRRMLRVDDKEMPFETEEDVVGDELLFDTVDGKGIPGSLQSEGTLLALGVLTALALPTRARLVLLDDIETGIHPAAQRQLMQVLRRITEQDPDLQLILTTHSPYILDEMRPEDVWVLGRSSEGVVAAKRLADNPRADEAMRVLTTGEFWSTEGEDWTAEGAS
jgi:predicted ATPase